MLGRKGRKKRERKRDRREKGDTQEGEKVSGMIKIIPSRDDMYVTIGGILRGSDKLRSQ